MWSSREEHIFVRKTPLFDSVQRTQQFKGLCIMSVVLRTQLSSSDQHSHTNVANVATLSQVLNLNNHEMDQVTDFLGHDICVHREYNRLPESTTQLAKISKLLFAMEKGSLSNIQGKSLLCIVIQSLD